MENKNKEEILNDYLDDILAKKKQIIGSDLREMILAAMEEYKNQFTDQGKEAGWITEKPDFKGECVFVTATTYNRNDEGLIWDYKVWQIKKLDGENDKGEEIWYWGLLNGDGEEWGDLEDLRADMYKIISAPTNSLKK
jgi:hypothetical protein